jgi:hypothetical protein
MNLTSAQVTNDTPSFRIALLRIMGYNLACAAKIAASKKKAIGTLKANTSYSLR